MRKPLWGLFFQLTVVLGTQPLSGEEPCQTSQAADSYYDSSMYHSEDYPYDPRWCSISDVATARASGARGIWLPEDPILFRHCLADPRNITYSAGWRFNDKVIGKNVIDVSYGETIALYRWFCMGPWGGELQLEVEGALWAVFAPLKEESPLVNTDYYIGVPLTYRCGRWQYRLRGYHISSHLGDEFLLMNPNFKRVNPSAEYLDFWISHYFTDEIRFYGGLGYIVHYDSSFKCKRFFGDFGLEVRIPRLGFVDTTQQVFGTPIFAMHLRHREEFDKHVDMTYVLGYEWGKLCGLCRNLRIYAEYHNGYSAEGQFCWLPTNYLGFRVGYGY